MSERVNRRGVFLDLNGTLVLPVTPTALTDYAETPGCVEAVALLCDAGFVCPVVTVQSKIGKGLFTKADFETWFRTFRDRVASHGAFLEGPYVCPHRYGEPCACKKAGGALHRRAAADLGIDIGSSWVVGDSLEDVEAAHTLGCRSVLVRSGWATTPVTEARATFVADNVLGAARWIVAGHAD